MKKIDLTGQRFGRLIALEPTEKRCGHSIAWKCLCDCGNIHKVSARDLRSGHTKSCGCLSIEKTRERLTTHGCSKKNNETAEYRSWRGMRGRCLNPSHDRYRHYGERGISVCDRWSRFENFLEDMGEKSSPELSIERIDNDGNYEPGNCKWATQLEQCANTRKLRWFYAFNEKTGETHKSNNQQEFSRRHGLNSKNISACLSGKQKQHKGWTFKYMEV